MQIERVSKEDRIYEFEQLLEHDSLERINVYRWHWMPNGGYGYISATYIFPTGTYIKKGLIKMRRGVPLKGKNMG
jgi:hypothetical protein